MNPLGKVNFIIKNNYKDLLNKNIYEPLVCQIMNESKIVFPDEYKQIIEQSNGESDFVSNKNEFLDAKILIYNQQAIDMKKNKIDDFLDSIQEEQNQIFDTIMQQLPNVEQSKFYIEILHRLEKMKENENLVLFFPFDVTIEFEGSVTSSADIFSYIIDIIRGKNKKITDEHIIYMIYPNIENKIVLKKFSNQGDELEFLHSDLLKNYIEVIGIETQI